MQRRAAAVYVALFTIIGAAAAAGILTGWLPEKTNHLWGIAALSLTTAVVLGASAYMPVRRD